MPQQHLLVQSLWLLHVIAIDPPYLGVLDHPGGIPTFIGSCLGERTLQHWGKRISGYASPDYAEDLEELINGGHG